MLLSYIGKSIVKVIEQYYKQNKNAKKLSVQQHYEQNRDAKKFRQ